jgi:quinol monooxygenase YgiN
VTNYYVYYRVDADRVDALESEIRRLFDKIQKQSGVRGRWMRRRDDAATFMEVYEGVKDEQAFESVLAREGATLKLERKVERFVNA